MITFGVHAIKIIIFILFNIKMRQSITKQPTDINTTKNKNKINWIRTIMESVNLLVVAIITIWEMYFYKYEM